MHSGRVGHSGGPPNFSGSGTLARSETVLRLYLSAVGLVTTEVLTLSAEAGVVKVKFLASARVFASVRVAVRRRLRLAHRRHEVVDRLQLLVVVERHPAVLGDGAVAREQQGDRDVSVIECRLGVRSTGIERDEGERRLGRRGARARARRGCSTVRL